MTASKYTNTRSSYADTGRAAIDGIWSQTASGRVFPLEAPTASDIDFVNDIAPQLARQARFNGATDGFYSVAQHCALGADALYHETRRAEVAAHFLLHDAHEAVLGDTTTPVVEALAALGRSIGVGTAERDISHVFALLKAKVDAAIYRAAGLSHPDALIRALIKDMDIRLLATERRDLMRPPPRPWSESVERAQPVRGPRIKPLPWPKALDLWLDRLSRYCPAAITRRAR